MKLGFEESQSPYNSGSQSARAWTERWVRDWVYCPNCGNDKVVQFESNRPVADFFCRSCRNEYELKSKKTKFGKTIANGAFRTKLERLAADNNPNFFLLHYDLRALSVVNLLVVPKHYFVKEIIQERRPLAKTARRAGWVGSNILLDKIPPSGRIFIVQDGIPLPRSDVLSKWRRTLFLREERMDARGWLIEVMKRVESLGRAEFGIDDVYAFEDELRGVYPNNRHIREKIRQQLQVLRDRGYLDFVSRGNYRILHPNPAR